MKTRFILCLARPDGHRRLSARARHPPPRGRARHVARRAVPAQPLDGLEIPDVPLVDQDGRPVHFYSDLVKGRVVAMNFVFTTCTTICPPMGANFARLQKILGEKRADVRLISVSIDPADRHPRAAQGVGRRSSAPARAGRCVTGDREDVDRLLKALGVFTANVADHSPLVLLGDEPAHRWTRAYGLAAPAKLAELIDQIAARRRRDHGRPA